MGKPARIVLGDRSSKVTRSVASPRRRKAVRFLALAAASLGALVVGPSSGVGATPDTPFDTFRLGSPSSEAHATWGYRAAAARDLTGDGVNDFFVAAPTENIEGAREGGRVYLMSGADRSVARVFDPPPADRVDDLVFGFFISVPGDLDGDGKDDLAVGSDPVDPRVPQRVWIYNGATGALIDKIDNPATQANTRFGTRVGRAGDVSKPGADAAPVSGQDGKPDLIVGDSSYDDGAVRNQGRAYIFDGATRKLFRTLDLPAADRPCEACSFGGAVQGPGDVDKDGFEDQLVDAYGQEQSKGRMYVFSGATGGLIRAIDAPQRKVGGNFGFQDAAPLSPGDLNGDGHDDVYGNGFDHDGPAGPSQGRAWVFSGAEIAKGGGVLNTPLRTLDDPTPSQGGQFGWSMAKTDYNHDGTPDLYVGQAPHHGGGDQNGGTYVLDGKTGSPLKALEMPACDKQDGGAPFGPNLGWGLAAPGDLNGDGEDDYVAGAPYYDVGASQNQGRAYVFQSSDTGANPSPGPPGSSAGVTCTELRDGRRYIKGTPGNDTIVGTDEDDVIDAGDGDDVIVAKGGNDVVFAGGGNDAVNAGAGNDYVSGGEGNDRIAGSTGNDYLVGAGGDDLITGNEGGDRIIGDEGNDVLVGEDGDDVITGEAGNDYISGGTGDDRLSGGTGADRIRGDSGNDVIGGQEGDDRLYGGPDDDRLFGGPDDDRLYGEAGDDYLYGGPGRDRLDGGTGRNVLRQ